MTRPWGTYDAREAVKEGLARGLTQPQIAAELGTTRGAISGVIQRIRSNQKFGGAATALWSPDEIAILKAHPNHQPSALIALLPGRSADAITKRRLGINQEASLAQPRAAAPTPTPAPSATIFRPRKPEPCCWPLGEPGTRGFRFCCAETNGRIYCPEHDRLAFPGRRSAA